MEGVAAAKVIMILPSRWKIFWRADGLLPPLGLFLARKSFEARLNGLAGAPLDRME